MSLPGFPDLQAETAPHMAAPQPGDRFTEMYAFWMHVVAVGDGVQVEEYIPPCRVPDDAKPRTFATLAEFRAAYAYDHDPAKGYWINYVDNIAAAPQPATRRVLFVLTEDGQKVPLAEALAELGLMSDGGK